MLKAKILLIGPCKTGKSTLADFLSEKATEPSKHYRPTQGVRIQEFEAQATHPSGGRSDAVQVQLWDVSGDQQFKTGWAVIANGASGAVIVTDPDQPGQLEEVEPYFRYFVRDSGLRTSQCVVFANKSRFVTEDAPSVELPRFLAKARLEHTNVTEEPEAVREAFHSFLGRVRASLVESRDQQEDALIAG
eukprot:m.41698 g.41698  ORF g.41698 m.41698 type:complete len:190 (+) comp11490_c0_seq3:134-703(+)